MVKIFSYLAIKQNKEIWNQVAQLMVNPELTVKTLQLLIIGKSFSILIQDYQCIMIIFKMYLLKSILKLKII